VSLRNLAGGILWAISLEAGPDVKVLGAPLPKEAWDKLGFGQGSLEIEAFDQENRRLHRLTQQLWAIPDGQWQAFEAEEERIEARLCSPGQHVGGLSCEQFRTLHRAFRAKGRQYYTEAFRYAEAVPPLEETRQLAQCHARPLTAQKTESGRLTSDPGL
jgi:hypothetical protein